jgi:hypothetical protein
MAQLQTKKPRSYSITGGGDYFYTWQNAEIEPETGELHLSLILPGGNFANIKEARLRVDGQEIGNVYVDSITNFSSPQFTLAGTMDEWGVTTEQLKTSNVGFSFKFKIGDELLGSTSTTDGVTIDGFDLSALNSDIATKKILLIFDGDTKPIGGGSQLMQITSIRLGIEADITHRFNITNEIKMMATLSQKQPSNKAAEVIYSAYLKDGTYLGQIDTVTSTPAIQSEVNSLHSHMTMKLAQNDATTRSVVTEIMTEINENMLTELGYKIVGSITTPAGLGSGTNIDTNVSISASVRYGEYLPWLTEDGKTIITEDARIIVVTDGYPEGRSLFSGYISQWEISAGNTDSQVTATVLSHSQELNNIYLQTEAEVAYQHKPYGLATLGFGSRQWGYCNEIIQTIQVTTGSKTVAGIELYSVSSPGFRQDFLSGNMTTLYAQLISYSGDINTGVVEASGAVVIPVAGDIYEKLFIPFDKSVRMTSGKRFIIKLSARGGSRYENSFPYPVEMLVDRRGRFTTGQGLQHNNYHDNPFWQDFGWDLAFSLYESPGDYKRAFYSQDPSDILRELIDFAQKQGARCRYTESSIENTDTKVTIRFNDVTTISEAIAAVFKSMPADWHYYYDYAENIVHAHPRPTTVKRKLQRGKNVIGTPKLVKTIEELVNDVIFIGGEKADGKTLVVAGRDDRSIAEIRRGFKKLSDSRYKDETSVKLVVEGEIQRGSKPVFSGEATFASPKYEALDIHLGELTQYQGFSATMDAPEMQIVAITQKLETAELKFNILRPRLSKRIQDLKRNMDNRERESE